MSTQTLLQRKMKSDSGSRSERKTQNPAGVDSRSMVTAAPHQRWSDCQILRSRSSPDFLKLSPSLTAVQKLFSNVKSKSKLRSKNLKNAAFSQQKCHIYFTLARSKSCLVPKFWRDLQSGSNPTSTKIAIVRIQSNSSPFQCSSLLRMRLYYHGHYITTHDIVTMVVQ